MLARPYRTFCPLLRISAALCLCVVVLGAYVRLSDAGLGCPDWPGCYGQLLGVPQTSAEISNAEQNYQRPVEVGKAWKEMAHRYLAGSLGLLIFAFTALAIRNRRDPEQPVKLPLMLSALVIFQALLGMWTVTWSLMPIVVTAHLAGGMILLSLLWWLTLKTAGWRPAQKPVDGFNNRTFTVGTVCLALLGAQILLGGWVSSNYAALACPDFPTCHQQWLPAADFKQAFTLNYSTDANYEFGTLDNEARIAIHFLHRLGAVIIALVLGVYLLLMALRARTAGIRNVAVGTLVLLITQIALGISNVIFHLPLAVAAAHNAAAALLLMAMVTLLYMLKSGNGNPVSKSFSLD